LHRAPPLPSLSPITRATPQLIASATLRVETPGRGFTDITADVAGFIAQCQAGEELLLA